MTSRLFFATAMCMVCIIFAYFAYTKYYYTSKNERITMNPKTSDLQYEILKKTDDTATQAKPGDIVVVHYRGSLDDGTEFDSSFSRNEPLQFVLGKGQVIKGWDIGIALMKVGEKSKLTIPAELGYGKNGFPGVIPPNATLIFEVELLAVNP